MRAATVAGSGRKEVRSQKRKETVKHLMLPGKHTIDIAFAQIQFWFKKDNSRRHRWRHWVNLIANKQLANCCFKNEYTFECSTSNSYVTVVHKRRDPEGSSNRSLDFVATSPPPHTPHTPPLPSVRVMFTTNRFLMAIVRLFLLAFLSLTLVGPGNPESDSVSVSFPGSAHHFLIFPLFILLLLSASGRMQACSGEYWQ